MSNDNKINLSAPTPATFKAGDSVLCPSLSLNPFVLTNDPYGKRDVLALEYEGSYFYYDRNGYFVRANQNETDDFQPSLFADTPANRQAIATLYSGSHTSQRKVIDTTEADDNEVIVISSHDLSHIACDISGAITVLNDIGQLLGLIHYEKIDAHTAISMARLTQDATVTWSNLLHDQLEAIKETLAMTRYGKEGSQ
ncbi:hypothetical protein AADH33_09080 [Psychrobacter sp. KFRI-CH2-11]|uniref:hypothetical protein n=1 Tax=Psychrobacter sp. KFRI-CH2-11 TaxID=3156079 RepID=UPI0032529A79